jgi:hypothetical protein
VVIQLRPKAKLRTQCKLRREAQITHAVQITVRSTKLRAKRKLPLITARKGQITIIYHIIPGRILSADWSLIRFILRKRVSVLFELLIHLIQSC